MVLVTRGIRIVQPKCRVKILGECVFGGVWGLGGFILGSLLMWGALLGAFGIFDGGTEVEPEPEPEDDLVVGTVDGDILQGSGTQQVQGWGGDDDITLTQQAWGFGGKGDDQIHSNNSNSAFGQAGNDTLDGDRTKVLYGGGGDDDLMVSSGGTGWGDAGDDLLGGNPDDLPSYEKFLRGGDGEDTIVGSTDDRFLEGGDGDDLIMISDGDTTNTLGVIARLSDGNDVLLIDSGAVAFGDAAASTSPIAVTDYSAGNQIVLGDATEADLAALSWAEGPESLFTLYRGNEPSNLTVTTLDGNPPSGLIGAEWDVDEQSDLRGYMPDLPGPDGAQGTEGNDVLSANLGSAYGLGGDDTITGNMGGYIYGSDGNDLVTLFGADAFGGAGDDTKSGFAGLFGGDAGAGNDILIVGGGGDGAEIEFKASALGESGTDTFVVDMTLRDDGAMVILGDYVVGEKIVLAIDPADVASADWTASSDTSPGHDFDLYTLNVHLTDGSTFTIQIPRDASNYDPDSLADIPLILDPGAVSALMA